MQQEICYDCYALSLKECLLYAAEGIGVMAVFVYVFYRSILLFWLLLLPAACYPLHKRKALAREREKRLVSEFRDAILAIAAALRAGYAVENAMEEALKELKILHAGKESLMVRELEGMLYKIRMNQAAEMVFLDFGKRSGVDVIQEFAEIFAAAKKSGGELIRMVDRTAVWIGEKIQVKEEISVITAARRYEQKLMNGMPLFLVLYLDVSSPDYFAILYQTLFGRMVMTVCLGIYLFAIWMAERILKIEV